MSSILEALKKLEDEKAARRGGIGNITGKVATAGRRAGQSPRWIMAAAMAAVAVTAVAGTYAAMKWLSPQHPVPVAAKITVPSPQGPAGSTPQPAATAATTGSVSSSALPVATRRENAAEKPAAAIEAHATPPSAAKVPGQPIRRRPATADRNAPPPAPTAKPQIPVLSVTGIAWQQQNGSRLAVVNDIPVTEGSLIEGARVKEIFPDHLRFSIQGKDFDIYLDKDQ